MMERTYRVNDVVQSEFLRLPLTLLANPQYKQMSLEAKFVYSLLLNRMTLSQRNDWINENSEVYIIYTREEAANTLNISYKKSIAAFKELIQNELLLEQRQGLGAPNLLYVLKAELTDKDALEFSDNFDGTNTENEQKEPETPVNMQICQNGISRHAEMTHQDMSKSHIKNCQNGTSRTAESAGQDMPKRHTKKIDNKKTEISYIENSKSTYHCMEKMTEEEILQTIMDNCELHLFSDNVRQMLVQAIERLYYSETLKIGNAKLPQAKVRSYLNLLTGDILLSVVNILKQNEENIINPTAYLMSTIINTICESVSDQILNLPPSFISNSDLYSTSDEIYDTGVDENGTIHDDGPRINVGTAKSIRGAP